MIRPYRPADREAVREISCDTADHGRPVENFFGDRRLVADLLTRYYTDIDPRGVWIAESAGEVVGYLTGALDTRRSQKAMALRVIPRAVLSALPRGTLLHPQTWRMVKAGLETLRRGGHRRQIPFDLYPAHLHINLRENFRGRGAGRALVERFLGQLRELKCPGVHAVVGSLNEASRRFFERMGFAEISRQPTVFIHGGDFKKGETIVFARKVA